MKKHIFRFTRSMIISTLAVVSFALFITAGADGQDDAGRYLERARAYADTMMEKGRDRWGEHTPLFASVMNRKTHDLLRVPMQVQYESNTGVTRVTYAEGKDPHGFGAAAVDRVMGSAKVTDDNQLYRLLYKLSETTGKEKYREAADASYRYFWLNCQDPNTGLMAWAEHTAWHLPEDAWFTSAPVNRLHEPAWFPYFDRLYRMGGPVRRAMDRYVKGVWRWQIGDHENFRWSRHCHLSSFPGTARTGSDYPRIYGQWCWQWAYVLDRTQDRLLRSELSRALDTLLEKVLSMRAENGAFRRYYNQTYDEIQDRIWMNQNIQMMILFRRAQDRLSSGRAEKVRRMHRSQRDVLVEKIDHPMTPENTYFRMGRASDFSVIPKRADSHYSSVRDGSTATMALRMLAYDRLEDDAGMRQLAMNGAKLHLETDEPSYSKKARPGAVAAPLRLMLRAYQRTDDEAYLERAKQYAEDGIDLFLDNQSPLPMVQRGVAKVYESRTDGTNLMLGLYELHKVLQGNELDPVFVGR